LVTSRPDGARSIDDILAAARSRLSRVTPGDAFAEFCTGATLIDIRPAGQRAADGEIPGSVIVERNHLEWRFDPASGARLPWVQGYDMRLLVICNEGYTSSLAAAALHDLGLRRATDITGGYQAWAAAGLPTARAEECAAVLATGATPAVVIPRELSRTCGGVS
jgi:rhodanese-related sulfurtransferase